MRNRNHLRDGVRRAYSSAAGKPGHKHPFPAGRHFAQSVGYPPDLLARLPSVSVAAFSGVSNVSVFAEIPAGSRVLDLGCGAGLDCLVAAERVGPQGKVIGIDFSEAMLTRAREAVALSGAAHVELRLADAERLPIEDGTIDVALANGIFNLNPGRDAIFRELARVLRTGGVCYAAELILREPFPPDFSPSQEDWFA